jgi:hypothetical protein
MFNTIFNAAGYLPFDLQTPTEINFVAQSMGSITSAMTVSYDVALQYLGASFTPSINKSVQNVGGANFAALLAESYEIKPLVDSLLACPSDSSKSIQKGTVGYYLFLSLNQWVLDPADPTNNINTTAAHSIASNTLIQSAYMDTFVPNSTNEVLASKFGFAKTDVSDFTLTNSEFSTTVGAWYQFGGTVKAITHGFLLSDSISGYSASIDYNQTDIQEAQRAAQKQIVNFLGLHN